jgi:hypothetical protein
MGKSSGPWDEGRKAWKRLTRWDEHGLAPDETAATGDAAISALTDISAMRRQLDRAEFVAVRRARMTSRSWAEIATALGITRQSAWERWRDVDADAPGDHASGEEIPVSARERRRRGTVVVPRLIGVRWDEARHHLEQLGLVGVRSDPDGPPLAALGWPNTVVTDQSPESGAMVPTSSIVTLWLERGDGSAGDREPRRPAPTPLEGRELPDESTVRAVG